MDAARSDVLLFFKRKPYLLVLYVLMMVYYPIRSVLVPYYLGKLTTKITKSQSDYAEVTRKLIVLIVTVILLQTSKQLLDAHTQPMLGDFVRNKALHGIVDSYRRNYRELESGDINVKLYQHPESITLEFKWTINDQIPAILSLVVAMYFFFKVHKTFGIIYVIFLCIYAIMIYVLSRVLRRDWFVHHQKMFKLHEEIDEFLVNLFAMYVGGSVDDEKTRLKDFSDAVVKQWTKANVHKSVFRSVSTTLKYCFLGSMIATAIMLRKSKSTVADVAPILFMTMTIEHMLYEATSVYIDKLYYSSSIDLTDQYIKEVNEEEVKAPPKDRMTSVVANGRIEYRDVTLTYRQAKKTVFSGVNLVVADKERVLITGSIGAGKSTLTKLMVGLHPYQGSIKIGGLEVSELSAAEINSVVQYIPQAPRLYNRTIYENLAFGLHGEELRPQIEALLARLAIPGFPDIDKMAGKSGSALSGGQRTIIYLIRAFLKKSKIVILDEPTASLDSETKKAVKNVVESLFEDRTLLIITHDFSVDWNQDQHWEVSNGSVTVK